MYHMLCATAIVTASKLPSTDVSKEEMYAFTAIGIAMGIINLPEIRDYWSTASILNVPWSRSISSHNCCE